MFSYLLKKLWIVVLFSIVCAFSLMLEKNYTTNFNVQRGEFIFGCKMNIENYKYEKDLFLYDKYLKDEINLKEFLTITEKNFCYEKFDATWNGKTFLEKCIWLNRNIIVNNFGKGRYSVFFIIREHDAKNYEYCVENGEKYLLNLCKYIERIYPQNTIVFTEPVVVKPMIFSVPKKIILIKYGVIGAILGSVLSVVVLCLIYRKRCNNA